MAVAFDNVGPSVAGKEGTTSPITWTHTCGASATYLLVGLSADWSTDTSATHTCTYNSVTVPFLGLVHSDATTKGFVAIFGLASPTTGSALTVSCASSGGVTLASLAGGSISFTGASSLGTFQSASGAGTPTLSYTPTTSGNLIFSSCGGGSTAMNSITTPGTEEWLNVGAPMTDDCGASSGGYSSSTGSAVTVAYSFSSGTHSWALGAVEVQAAAVAAVLPDLIMAPMRGY